MIALVIAVLGGVANRIRGGLFGEQIKAFTRAIHPRVQIAWRSVGDRLLTVGLLWGLIGYFSTGNLWAGLFAMALGYVGSIWGWAQWQDMGAIHDSLLSDFFMMAWRGVYWSGQVAAGLYLPSIWGVWDFTHIQLFFIVFSGLGLGLGYALYRLFEDRFNLGSRGVFYQNFLVNPETWAGFLMFGIAALAI